MKFLFSRPGQFEIRFVADITESGEVVDVTMYRQDSGEEPFGQQEYITDSVTDKLFDAVWEWYEDADRPWIQEVV